MGGTDFELIIENGVVTGYTGEANIVEIPENVVEIGCKAFSGCKFIESVNITSTVLKTINKSAFENCVNLKEFKLKSLKGSIEERAFSGCSNLLSLIIPDGVIKIGENAFSDCDKLVFVTVPASVFVIEGQIFDKDNKKTVILGNPGSEAEEYAQKNLLPFKEDTELIRSKLLSSVRNSEFNSYEDFNVFGEVVRCYKSLIVYQNSRDFFDKIYDEFPEKVFDCLPRSVSVYDNKKIGEIGLLANKYMDDTRVFLEKQGVYISHDMFEMKVSDLKLNYITVSKTFLETFIEIQKAIEENKDDLSEKLIAEAESKITGLSYGVIGDSLTMFGYAIDEARARNRQSKEAYKVAREKMASGTKEIYSVAQEAFAEFMSDTIIPALSESIDYVINGLFSFVINELVEAKVIVKEAYQNLDFVKSSKIISQAQSNDNIDKKYAIATALKLYPLNVDAINFAIKSGLVDKTLFDLIEFLDIPQNKVFVAFLDDFYDYKSLLDFKETYGDLIGSKLNNVLEIRVEKKAREIIKNINDGFDPAKLDSETWNDLIQKYDVVTPETLEVLNLTKEDIKAQSGQTVLSEAIQENNAIKEEQERRTREKRKYNYRIYKLKKEIEEDESLLISAGFGLKKKLWAFIVGVLILFDLIAGVFLFVQMAYWDFEITLCAFGVLMLVVGGYGCVAGTKWLKDEIRYDRDIVARIIANKKELEKELSESERFEDNEQYRTQLKEGARKKYIFKCHICGAAFAFDDELVDKNTNECLYCGSRMDVECISLSYDELDELMMRYFEGEELTQKELAILDAYN